MFWDMLVSQMKNDILQNEVIKERFVPGMKVGKLGLERRSRKSLDRNKCIFKDMK